MSGSVIPVESQSMIASGLMLILDPMPIPGRLRAGTSALYDRWACGLERFNVQQFGDRSHPVVWQFDRIPQNLGARRDAGAVDAAGGLGRRRQFTHPPRAVRAPPPQRAQLPPPATPHAET